MLDVSAQINTIIPVFHAQQSTSYINKVNSSLTLAHLPVKYICMISAAAEESSSIEVLLDFFTCIIMQKLFQKL